MIKQLVVHASPHLDEIVGAWELIRFGEKIFPGVSRAKIKIAYEEGYGRNLPRTLTIGCSGGQFDEHRKGNRIPDECAATLVAKRLGIINDPADRVILDEVLFCDTQPRVHVTQIAALIKMMHELKWEVWDVIRWTFCVLDCIYEHEKAKATFGELDYGSLRKLFHEVKGKYEDPESVQKMDEELKLSEKFSNDLVTEAVHAAAVVALIKPDIFREWSEVLLDVLYQNHIAFKEAVRIFLRDAQVHTLYIPHGGGEEPLAYIHSDHPLIAKAARSVKGGHNALVIVRNAKRQCQIFRHSSKLRSLATLTAMIRYLELYQIGRHRSADWKDLERPGIHPLVPHWCFVNDGLILNGSLSHPNIRPTTLSDENLIDAGVNAFVWSRIQDWQYRQTTKAVVRHTRHVVHQKHPKPLASVGDALKRATA